MSDTVMLVVGLVGWAVVGGLVWWVDRRAKARTTEIESRPMNAIPPDPRIAELASLMSDLDLRVARAEATIAATPTPPDPATIIAAATAPLLALTEQYTSPHQILAPGVAQPTAGDGEWSAEDLAAYDPTDEDFPPYRAADDYSPPASFSGLGVELPRLDG